MILVFRTELRCPQKVRAAMTNKEIEDFIMHEVDAEVELSVNKHLDEEISALLCGNCAPAKGIS